MYELDKSMWKLDDREWLKQRKQEWREVKTNLGNMSIEIERKAHKYHKDYFLKGELDPMIFASVDEQIFNNFPTVFAGGKLFFDIWYAPEFELERFQDIFDNEDHEGDLWRARDFLFRFNQSEFSTPYGMMGGREKEAVQILFPDFDYQKVKMDRSKEYPLCFSPERTISACLSDLNPLLSSYEYNPYAPGQYLWDHMIHSMRLYPDVVAGYFSKKVRAIGLREILVDIQDFNERDGEHRVRETSRQWRDKLLGLLEARELPEPFLSIWPKAKSAYESGVSDSFIETGEL